MWSKYFFCHKTCEVFAAYSRLVFILKLLIKATRSLVWLVPSAKKMEMIRHDAIGMNGKISRRGFRAKDVEQPLAAFWVCEYFVALVTAHGYEINVLPLVCGIL